MKTMTALKPARIAALLAAMTAASLTPGFAANFYWDGSNSSFWSDSLNWVGDSAPTNNITSDVAVFSGTTAYANQPTIDAFTVRSINGLSIGGPLTVLTTLSAATSALDTTSSSTSGSNTLALSDVSNLKVGQVLTGSGIPVGTFISAIDTQNNTVTLSRPTTGTTANNAVITAASALRLGSGGITLLADTPTFGSTTHNTITAPLLLGANQTWTNSTTNRTLQIQGSINLESHTLTFNGAAGSTISLNGGNTAQAIVGSGSLVVDTDGTVSIGSGSGGRPQHTFTGGVRLNKGTLAIQGGNTSAGGTAGNLGTGILTINGGRITGGGNIASNPLAISGQVWNADWTYGGGRAIHMGTGAINLGTTAGTSRTITATDSNAGYTMTFGGAISNGTTANTIIKEGVGRIAFAGNNTYTGDTVVNNGYLTLTSTGGLTFYVGANGVNNQVRGAALGNVIFEGAFNFDLTLADTTNGNSWLIVDKSSISATFSETFNVAGFSQENDIWTSGNYTFSEATGYLTYGVIPEPSTYAALVGAGFLGLAVMRRKRRS